MVYFLFYMEKLATIWKESKIWFGLLHIDGDIYERLKSVLPNFPEEAKHLITSMRIIWDSWNRQTYFFL
jgi:hypothetical protein